MNITSKGTRLSSHNPAWTRAFLGLGALIVALGAISGFIALQADRDGSVPVAESAPALPQASEGYIPATLPPAVIFYLVNSDLQAQQARDAENEAQTAMMDLPGLGNRSYRIIQVETPEQQSEVLMMIGATGAELAQGGTSTLQVVDLRPAD